MKYKYIVILMVLLPILSAFISYNVGIIRVFSRCDTHGKYQLSDIVLMCTVKDKVMLGTSLSWSNRD